MRGAVGGVLKNGTGTSQQTKMLNAIEWSLGATHFFNSPLVLDESAAD
jgi:hypothetical protein